MRRALGKGLSQLIADQSENAPSEAPIEAISPNARQPRTQFDEEALDELAASIREHGILQPLVVRPLSEGRYELIAGERRLRAAKRAGLERVPILLRSADNQSSLEIALIENIQREDIGAAECAIAYRRLMDEFGLTQEQVAEKVGKSRAAIANTVRLLRLPRPIFEGLEQGRITEGHARALLAFESHALQLALYEKILTKGLTVRDLERLAQERPRRREPRPATFDPHWDALQDRLSTHLSSPVRLSKAPKGGKIQIEFYSDDDLQRILDVLGISL